MNVAARLLLGVAIAGAAAGAACDATPRASAQEEPPAAQAEQDESVEEAARESEEAAAQALARRGSSAASCYLLADDVTNLLTNDLFNLCRGAPTPAGPVQCYLAAQDRLDLTTTQNVQLCQCAASTEPVDCWEAVDEQTTLIDEQIERLCVPRISQGLLPNCRQVGSSDDGAYGGSYGGY